MRHFDVQLIGGMVLHEGKIAEMKTGEGKTLVATLPSYLNALTGKGVHIVTVNDYLARRDAEWMGPIYKMLGLTVGVIVHDLDDVQRRAAYAADITYGTNNEFGFDYLRDNMKYDLKDCVPARASLRDRGRSGLHSHRRSPHAADYFRPRRGSYRQVLPHRQNHSQAHSGHRLHARREDAHRHADGRGRVEMRGGCSVSAICTTRRTWSLFTTSIRGCAHTPCSSATSITSSRMAKLVIVDEFTGRQMPGRRWSAACIRPMEAKEGVKIEREKSNPRHHHLQELFQDV